MASDESKKCVCGIIACIILGLLTGLGASSAILVIPIVGSKLVCSILGGFAGGLAGYASSCK